jgi:hypothetical protein
MPAISAVCLLPAGRPSGVWACEAGHEAALVRRDGTDAVAMDEGSI